MKKSILLLVAVACALLIASCDSTGSTTKYQVSISAVPNEGGTVSPTGGKYEEGKKLDISATPADSSWQFDNWSGDFQGTSASATITIDKPKNIKANFSKKNFDLTVNTEGEGTVEQKVLAPSSINGYEIGTTVELTAKPSEGWKFVKWTGDISTSENPTQVTVDNAKEVTAVFEKKSYELTVSIQGQGAVKQEVVQTNAAANYDYDTIVQLTANPSKGWKFVKWTGDLTGSKNPDQITIDNPKKVTAVFEKKNFAVSVSVSGKGTVTKDPDQENYVYNSTIDLTANPEAGYKFVKWQGDINATENPLTVTVDTTKDITAVFEKKSFALKINLNGKGSVAKNPDQNEYKFQSTVDLTAKPDQGWKFVKWTGDISTTDNPTQITVDKAKEITAVFAAQNYKISTSIKGDGDINLSPQKGNYQYNDKVQFTASAEKGYIFINWNGDLNGNKNPQTLQVTKDITVEAIFKTPEEALIYQLGGGVYINGRVNSATLNLYNTLPKSVELRRFALLDQNDNLVVENKDGATIEAGKGIGYTVSFGIPPTTETFNNYKVRWEVEYNGNSYVKENLVKNSNSNQKGEINSMSVSKTLKLSTKK